MFTLFSDVPDEVNACLNVAYEGYDVVLFVIKHLDLAADGVNILANLA